MTSSTLYFRASYAVCSSPQTTFVLFLCSEPWVADCSSRKPGSSWQLSPQRWLRARPLPCLTYDADGYFPCGCLLQLTPSLHDRSQLLAYVVLAWWHACCHWTCSHPQDSCQHEQNCLFCGFIYPKLLAITRHGYVFPFLKFRLISSLAEDIWTWSFSEEDGNSWMRCWRGAG
jgi:hypothetical protein